MTVIDNSANDQNKTSGKFQVQLPGAGTYSICVAFPPPGYQFVPPYTVCQTYYFNLGMSVGFGHYRVQAVN